MKKRIVLALILIILMAFPFLHAPKVSAATLSDAILEELKIQIQQLLQILKQLTQQLLELAENQPQQLADISWSCGESVTFAYKEQMVTYGTVESQGRCWLDRNLGASRVATDSMDKLAAGDLFQWGRGDDGHQDCDLSRGEFTDKISTSDNPGHDKCITGYMNDDWRVPKNDNLWQGVNGINNPCPQGWRVPTKDEWETERLSWPSNNAEGAFNSPLRLPTTGVRVWGDQPLMGRSIGAYWSSTVPTGKNQEFDYSQLPYAYRLSFRNYSVFNQKDFQDFPGKDTPESVRQNNASIDLAVRVNGYAVRCIKD